MKTSEPLFDKILENNQLIKGRLNLKKYDLEKLYKALRKKNSRLKKKLDHQEELIRSNITKRNNINSQIKKNIESIKKSFYPSTNKISLLHKRQGEFYYIKARFYWGGKQREVQVGSIPNVIEIINSMIINKTVIEIKLVRKNNITWEQINKRPILLDIIKEISSIKAQEYVLRRLMNKQLNNINNNIYEDAIIEQTDINYKPNYEEEDELSEGVEWYKKWRQNNL